MITVQATDAKSRLAELLRAVEHGEEFAITRHGKTIAHLVPVSSTKAAEDAETKRRREALDRFREKQRTWKKAKMSVEEILEARHEGHRF